MAKYDYPRVVVTGIGIFTSIGCNRIDFWNSIEKFTPCEIEIDNEKKPPFVKNIQKEVLGDYDLPWLDKDKKRFKHFETKEKSWVYTVFLGIVESLRGFGFPIVPVRVEF